MLAEARPLARRCRVGPLRPGTIAERVRRKVCALLTRAFER